MSIQEEIDDDNFSDSSEFSVELDYDLEGLKKITSDIFGKSCISANKFGEGGFHKVFLLKMEDDSEYIGRIAFPDYPYWKTESEVAVMKYVKERTSIRVPEVYHYGSNKENLVGQEFIIMEKLPGISLSDVWDDYNINEKKKILLQVIEIQCILKNQKFSKIGGIFYDNNIRDFIIGQAVETAFFCEKRSELNIKRGPFDNTYDYIIAAIEKEIIYNENYFDEEEQKKWIPVYEELLSLVPKCFNNDDDIFVLFHGDFHSTNILVDGTNITGVIDWECSGSYPLECFCTYPVWITDNPFEDIDEKKSEEYHLLQDFWSEEMKNRDPEFIKIMYDMDNFKSVIYHSAFIIYAETGRILDSLENLRKNNS
jgi:aminoglycoside phosphotransferase